MYTGDSWGHFPSILDMPLKFSEDLYQILILRIQSETIKSECPVVGPRYESFKKSSEVIFKDHHS